MHEKSQLDTSFDFQESLKEFNRLQDYARIENERLRYVHEASRLPILDAYLRGELSLLCDMQAFFEIDTVGRSLKVSTAEAGLLLATLVLHLNSANVPLSQNGEQEPMLVPVVEIVNGPDGVIPSIVRLYLVNHEIEEKQTGGVYVSLSQRALKFFDILVNREFSPIIDVSRKQLFDRLQPRIIQGALQVMDSITKNEREIIQSGNILEGVYESVCTMLRVNLNNSSIGLMKRANACFEIMNVYIGPLNFESSIAQEHG